jgi:hypothetical protein
MTKAKQLEVDRRIVTDLQRQASQLRAFVRPDDEEPADIAVRILFYAAEVEAIIKFVRLCETMPVDRAWRVAMGH